VAILLAIVVTAWAIRSHLLDGVLDLARVRALIEAHEPYGPLVFIGLCVLTILLHLPEIVVIAIGGALFGTVEAFAYGWIGCLLGATLTFALVRYAAREAVQRALITRFPRLRALDERLARHGFWTVFVLRVFLFAAPPLNWGLGATRVRPAHYLAGTAFGVLPGIGTAVLIGGTLSGAGAPAGVSPGVIVPALLGGGAVLIAALGRMFSR
jgi:uncharacterized membrane protein YdjX (TVP38/TMEM64 family)